MFRAALLPLVIAAGGPAAVAGAGPGQRRVVLDSRTGQGRMDGPIACLASASAHGEPTDRRRASELWREIVGERWTLLILRDAVLGVERFEDFQQSLGIASNVLTDRLKLLCDEGVLVRGPDEQRPGRPKYSLTDKGRELAPVLITLMKWGDRHYPAPGGPPRLTLHAGCRGDVRDGFRCERCGQRPGPAELELRPGPGLSPTTRARSS